MSSRLLLGFVMSALCTIGCGGAPPDVAAQIAAFHEQADAGRLDEIRRLRTRADWDKYMSVRAALLGRTVSSVPMQVFDVDAGDVRVVTVRSNTQFERGSAMETFKFVKGRQDSGVTLSVYDYDVRKRVVCPPVTLSPNRCWIENVAVVTSSR